MKREELNPELQQLLKQHEKSVSETGFVDQQNMSVEAAMKQDKKEMPEMFSEIPELLDVDTEAEYTETEQQAQTPVQGSLEQQQGETDIPPEDPEERLEWAVKRMNDLYPASPGIEQIRQWKNRYGNVFICNFDEKLFIYRYLNRQEWAQAQATVKFDQMNPIQQEDFFFDKCILYPKLSLGQKALLPARLVSVLVEQIQIQSGFISPDYLANFTMKI